MWDAETRRAWSRAYYRKHPEKRRALARASYEKHREKRIAYVRAYYQKNKTAIAEYNRAYRKSHRKERIAAIHNWRLKNPAYALLASAKQRAKRLNVPFSLTLADIVIPKVCPILGMRLQHSKTRRPCDASPSLDRKTPKLGYTRGNITIISWRANVIKRDATPEELRAVAAWVSKES